MNISLEVTVDAQHTCFGQSMRLSYWFPFKAVLRDSCPFLKAFVGVPVLFFLREIIRKMKGIVGMVSSILFKGFLKGFLSAEGVFKGFLSFYSNVL